MTHEENNYILEFHVIGNSVKVTAIDPQTLTEVSIVGPANASKEQLSQNAVRKLIYMLNKDAP